MVWMISRQILWSRNLSGPCCFPNWDVASIFDSNIFSRCIVRMASLVNGAASSSVQRLYSKGIYHGLPDLSSAPSGMTAVVTGANGISGAHMVRALAENPDRWSRIYALSRRPPSGKWPKTVEHVPVDFLESPEEIAKILHDRRIIPDYIFFFSYVLITDESGALQWGDQRLVDQNSNLDVRNCLVAVD